MSYISIAIDGPAGAGKSTIAKGVAKNLGFVYVDTGAMYRAVTLYALKNGFDPLDEERLNSELKNIDIKLDSQDNVFLNGEDVSKAIRVNEVSKLTSPVSAFPKVRKYLVDLQRKIALTDNIIMDGRDIGTNVLPNAQLKIFMIATPQCRAERRYNELIERGETPVYEDILKDIQERDYRDSHRAINPMVKADDAIELDTSGMNLEQGIQAVMNIVNDKFGGSL